MIVLVLLERKKKEQTNKQKRSSLFFFFIISFCANIYLYSADTNPTYAHATTACLQAYYVLDEVFLGGVLLETSANVMEKKLEAQERVSGVV